jgi:hypothetical protein
LANIFLQQKIIFDQLQKLSFIFFQKFPSLEKNFLFLFLFLFFLFFFPFPSSLMFFSLPPSFLLTNSKTQATQSTNRGRAPLQPSLLVRPPAPPPSPSFPSPVSSHGCLPWSFNYGHGRLPWRASHKLIFLHGMIKMDAHDLPLAIHTLNFIRNEL